VKFNIGLVDSYAIFKQPATAGDSLSNNMSLSNHPNAKGHLLIAGEIMKFLK